VETLLLFLSRKLARVNELRSAVLLDGDGSNDYLLPVYAVEEGVLREAAGLALDNPKALETLSYRLRSESASLLMSVRKTGRKTTAKATLLEVKSLAERIERTDLLQAEFKNGWQSNAA
jgi:hypothetical protein